MTLLDRFKAPGPKRILALDGGGIRGAITVGYLTRFEDILRRRTGNPDLVLCDYFDMMAGTSTGSIIAGLLAIGKSAGEIAQMYETLGGEIFRKERSWWKPWQIDDKLEASFSSEPLEKELGKIFGDLTLGSEEPDAKTGAQIRTGLCIVTKRADTQSTWPLINHPDGKYFEDNKDIPLRTAIRASTAAPTFFKPEGIHVGKGEMGAFVDGGVSMFNNPGLQALYVACLKGFPFRWQMGADKLLLVSVGTGYWETRRTPAQVLDSKIWNWATGIPGIMMQDATANNQIILQWLSHSPTAKMIDTEIGDLGDDHLGPGPLLSYLRYDVEMTQEGLSRAGVPAELAAQAEQLRDMSDAKNRNKLAELGQAAAKTEVAEDHLPAAFDLPKVNPAAN